MKKTLLSVLLGLAFVLSAYSQGAILTFTSQQNGDWDDPDVWGLNGTEILLNGGDAFPNSNDIVTIEHRVAVTADHESDDVIIDLQNGQDAALIVDNAQTLTLGGDFTSNTTNVPNASLIVDVLGDLIVGGDFTYSKSGNSGAAEPDTLRVQVGGAITISGDLIYTSTSNAGRALLIDGTLSCVNFDFDNTDCPTEVEVNGVLNATGNLTYNADGTDDGVIQHTFVSTGDINVTGNSTFSMQDAAGGLYNLGGTFDCVDFGITNTDSPSQFTASGTITTSNEFDFTKNGSTDGIARDVFNVTTAGSLSIAGLFDINPVGVIGTDFNFDGDITANNISYDKNEADANNTADIFTIDNGAIITGTGGSIDFRNRAVGDLEIDVINGTIRTTGENDLLRIRSTGTNGGAIVVDLNQNGTISTVDGNILFHNQGTGAYQLDVDGTIFAGASITANRQLQIYTTGANAHSLDVNITSNADIDTEDGNIIIQNNNQTGEVLTFDMVGGSLTAGGNRNMILRSTQTTAGATTFNFTNVDVNAGNAITISTASDATFTFLANGTTDIEATTGAITVTNNGDVAAFDFDLQNTAAFDAGGAITFSHTGLSLFDIDLSNSTRIESDNNVIFRSSDNGDMTVDLGDDVVVDAFTFQLNQNQAAATGENTMTINGSDLNLAGNFLSTMSGQGINTILIDGATTLDALDINLTIGSGSTNGATNTVTIQGSTVVTLSDDIALANASDGTNTLTIQESVSVVGADQFAATVSSGATGINHAIFQDDVTLSFSGTFRATMQGEGTNNIDLLNNASITAGATTLQVNNTSTATGVNDLDFTDNSSFTANGAAVVLNNDGAASNNLFVDNTTFSVGADLDLTIQDEGTGDNTASLTATNLSVAVDIDLTGQNSDPGSGDNNLTILSDITVGSNIEFSNNDAGLSTLQFGDAANEITTAVGGNIAFSLSDAATDTRSILSLANGTINLTGNWTMSNSGGADQLGNQLLLDDATFGATTKTINTLGDLTPTAGQISYTDQPSSTFAWVFNANGTQNWTTNPTNFRLNDVTVSSTSTTRFLSAFDDLDIHNTVTVNGILDLNGNQPTLAGTNQIHINNAATLLNSTGTDAMQYHPTAIVFESAAFMEFANSGGGSIEILNSGGTAYSIPNVILTGTRTKRIAQNIGGTFQVGHIDIQDDNNDVDFLLGVTELSLTNGISTIANQELIVNANTVLDFNEAIATFTGTLTAEDDSEVQYTNNATTVFSADYFRLTFGGATTKTLTGSNTEVRDRLSKSGNGDIDLADTYITLLSNQVYDGYLGQINNAGDFVYNGDGLFILDKRVPVNTEDLGFIGNSGSYFRDFTIPIQEATLANFQTAGITLYKKNGAANGFTNWGNDIASVFSYNESLSSGGEANDGFEEPTANTDLISSAPNKGWKLALGQRNASTPYTFKDTGMVYTKNQSHTLSFTADAGDNDALRGTNNGWHLIGNPYPCTVDLDATINDGSNNDFMLAAETEGILATVWVKAPYDVTNDVFADAGEDYPYAFYNVRTGVGDPNAALIPSHNAFWLKTFVPQADGNSGSFNFRFEESHKVDGQQEIRKSDTKTDKPTVYDIRLLSENSSKLGIISFHEFVGASEGHNVGLDIEKFGSKANAFNAKIDFFSTQPMSLRVNAIGTKKHIQQFAFDVSANAGNYKLDLSGLQEYATKYTCAFLHDLVTGEHINLKDTTSSIYDFTVTTAETAGRFLVDYNTKNPSLDIYQPTCHNDNDGGVTLDAGSLIGSASFSIYKGLDKVASYSGEETFKTTLLPGEYTLVDNSGNLACAADKRITFTIENPPALAASFETEQSVEQGKETTLINTSENAETYEWYFADDMSYSSDENPTHTFAEQGKTMVSLTAYRNDGKCETHLNQYVYVNELTGLEGIQADEDIHITTSGNNQLSIETFAEGTYSIFTTDGKQVKAGKFSKGKTTLQLNVAGTYLVSVTTLGETITRKISIQ